MARDYAQAGTPICLLISAYRSSIPVYTLAFCENEKLSPILSDYGSERIWHRLDDVIDFIRLHYEGMPAVRLVIQATEI